MTILSDIPGWSITELGSLGHWGSGGTPSRSILAYYEGGHIPWLVIGDLNEGIVFSAKATITEAGLENSSAKLLPPGALLVAMYGSIGKTSITGVPCATNQAIAFCIPHTGVNLGYLHRAIQWAKPALVAQGQGGAQQNISQGILKAHLIPVAPEAEQKRIADKLDTVLTRVDAVNTRLARVAPLLKRFRQSVLAAATSGRLTEDWRGDSVPDWATHKLGDLLEGKPRNGYSPKAVDYETPVRSLTLSATTSGTFKGEHAKYIDEEIPDDSHLWLEPEDILIQRANSLEYVGVSAIFNGPEKSFIYPDLMMKARANARTTSRFLHLLLCAEGTRKYFRENATGTAGNMPKINQQTVINAPCRLPTLAEQTEIVRRVETLFAFANRLEARLAQAQTAATRLTPALLAKAFRGELVPQDPNDEPAAELLRRLAQATALPAKPKSRRAKTLSSES